MSASLVGSEMCIRDRFIARGKLGQLRAVWGAARRDAVPGGFRASFRAAVSYTHLTLPTICSV
eukprot:11441587-Alexandrium_andersonii.AAC.1